MVLLAVILPLYCHGVFLKLNDISALPQKAPNIQPTPRISKRSAITETAIFLPPKCQRVFFTGSSCGGNSSIFLINCFLVSDSFSAFSQNDLPSFSASSISSFSSVFLGGLGTWCFTVSRFSSFARFNGIISDIRFDSTFSSEREPATIPALFASSITSASRELIETVLPATSASLLISSKL